MAHCPYHNDALSRPRVMRIMDQNVKQLFLGSMSLDRLGPEERVFATFCDT